MATFTIVSHFKMGLKITCFAVYFVFYIVLGSSQTIDEDNVCYKGVKPRLDELINLYKNSLPVSGNTTFPDIDSIIKEIEAIISNITDLQSTFDKSKGIEKVVADETNKTKQLEEALDLLKKLMKQITKMNKRKDIHEEALNMCSETSELYEKLKNDVTAIKETGNALKDAMGNILKRAADLNTRSEQIKNDLDSINIPELTFQHYVCDSKLQATIKNIIDSIRNIADILRSEFKVVLQNKLRDIEMDVNKTEKDITNIKDNLNKEFPQTDIKITDQTQPTVDDLKNKLRELKDKLENIKLDQANNGLLEGVKEKLNGLVIEYETILKYLLSKENLDKVRQELELASKTLKLVKERNAFKTQLEEVKKIVNTLKEKKVCLKDKISVEG